MKCYLFFGHFLPEAKAMLFVALTLTTAITTGNHKPVSIFSQAHSVLLIRTTNLCHSAILLPTMQHKYGFLSRQSNVLKHYDQQQPLTTLSDLCISEVSWGLHHSNTKGDLCLTYAQLSINYIRDFSNRYL